MAARPGTLYDRKERGMSAAALHHLLWHARQRQIFMVLAREYSSCPESRRTAVLQAARFFNRYIVHQLQHASRRDADRGSRR